MMSTIDTAVHGDVYRSMTLIVGDIYLEFEIDRASPGTRQPVVPVVERHVAMWQSAH
jgi:hypothetical protein